MESLKNMYEEFGICDAIYAVSYTNMKLPTRTVVYISVVAGS